MYWWMKYAVVEKEQMKKEKLVGLFRKLNCNLVILTFAWCHGLLILTGFFWGWVLNLG